MKTIHVIIAFNAGIILVSSCHKDNMTVMVKDYGKLSLQISDSTGKKYEGVKVHLYTSISSGTSGNYYSGELDARKTDKNGSIDFGALSAGTYYSVTDTVKVGNKKYLISKAFQVLSGISKELILNPSEYVGNVKLKITLSNNTLDTLHFSSIKVALVNSSDYSYLLNRQAVINKAVAISTVDSKGTVTFSKIPSDVDLLVYGYINNTDTVGAWSVNVKVIKDETYSDNVDFYANQLYTA